MKTVKSIPVKYSSGPTFFSRLIGVPTTQTGSVQCTEYSVEQYYRHILRINPPLTFALRRGQNQNKQDKQTVCPVCITLLLSERLKNTPVYQHPFYQSFKLYIYIYIENMTIIFNLYLLVPNLRYQA
ncbi:hypothetical protein P168DRAFT_158640 [Aspergillus campestris IBT 28561]|uniref:Uncharacterized protein n=1 Tax=Aspergillus campestris (strain IBT 28561) TaxID=1392248 RepID=A0A2I1D3P7_ASPC2|nr:uncharacterized protein P168DRAFT_158640 [Aspergillus campestris IBT 28561]PKY04478.1 hypothetical protein P168DRAFT_158640 [Aspergillus campestris IBT 28561]